MGLVFLVVVGGTLGWLATIVARAEDRPGMLRNGAAGIAGALVSGLVLTPLIGDGDLLHGTYSVEALLISLVGTVVLLCAVNLGRGRSLRRAMGTNSSPSV